MILRNKVRQWLGLDEIDIAILHLANSQQTSDRIARGIENKVIQIERKTTVMFDGISRIVAKIDPTFHIDEQDPARIAESKRIEEATKRRLYGEALAREPYNK